MSQVTVINRSVGEINCEEVASKELECYGYSSHKDTHLRHKMRRKIVFIMGVGHSGSTLLDLLLGSHPNCFSLGELSSLSTLYKKDKTLAKVCGICDESCEFWNERVNLSLVTASLDVSNTSMPTCLIRYLINKMFNPYAHFFSKLSQHVLIDSSKSPDWISRQISTQAFGTKSIETYLLFLVRDGRAVVNSILRKYPDRTIEDVSYQWTDQMTGMKEFYDGFTSGRKMIVHYEDLATQTAATLEDVCAFLGIEFVPAMLEYWRHDHHLVSGNLGTRSLVWRAKQTRLAEIDEVQRRHGAHYNQIDLSIQLDMRWQDELSPEQVEMFERIAGSVHESFKYES